MYALCTRKRQLIPIYIYTHVYSEDTTSGPRPLITTTATSSSSKSSSSTAVLVTNKDALALLARSPKLQVRIFTYLTSHTSFTPYRLSILYARTV